MPLPGNSATVTVSFHAAAHRTGDEPGVRYEWQVNGRYFSNQRSFAARFPRGTNTVSLIVWRESAIVSTGAATLSVR